MILERQYAKGSTDDQVPFDNSYAKKIFLYDTFNADLYSLVNLSSLSQYTV